MMDILTGFALVGAAVSLAAWAIAVAKCKMENGKCRIVESFSFYRNCTNPPFSIFHSKFSIHAAAFVFFATIATLSAQKQGGGTNAPPQGASPPQMMMGSPLAMLQTPAVSSDDVARGYRLDYEFTNAAYSYAMPTNGVRYDKWWKRGAYEDVFRLDLGGVSFPLADELLSSFWVYSWGMAGAHLGNASNRLVATGMPMSAVPGLSQFWSAALPDGARRLTWQDFALNRDTNTPVSAQLELFPNGDFIARSNEVMRVYRRVNPDDWDDDGDPNGTDPDPYVAGEPTFGLQQQLPQGANSNAYCWVDLVVSGTASLVTFSGEGASNLPDPSFIALPGETNRVMLLIGKEYRVASRMPICCVGLSDYAIEVSQDSATSLSIVWPVTIEPVAMRSGASFSMSVTPDCLGGGFTWTNCCCSISSSGNSFAYSCDENCHCSGCAALGCYTYEGFTLPASGGSCGCAGISEPGSGTEEEDDDGPYAGWASATFTKSAIIFEDPYENTPGSWVGRHSTTSVLQCVAHGGPNGGHVRFDVPGEARLNLLSGPLLPLERDVSEGKKVEFSVIYEGVSPSASAGDIVATATFTENAEGADPVSISNSLTCVRVDLEAVYAAPANSNQNRHTYGVGETIKCSHTPVAVPLQWSLASHEYDNTIMEASGCDKEITFSHLSQNAPEIMVSSIDAVYHPQYALVEPSSVIVYLATWDGECLPRGRAGGFGMRMRMYVYPMYVSFQGIDMVEVPCNVALPPFGYYATTNYNGPLSHTMETGAGFWHHVKAGNFWSEDHATSGERQGPWNSGRLVWNIPIAWNYRYDDPSDSWPNGHYASTCKTVGNDSDVQQVYCISANGTITIEKFDHEAERSTNDVVIVDEIIVHEGAH